MLDLRVSTNICHIPFIGHTDASRIQMSSKQLSQAISNINCEVPRVIGNNYRYLSDTSTLFRLAAPLKGEIIYNNKDLIVVLYKTDTDEIPEIYETPAVLTCSEIYATRLRYRRELGPFEVGDILYEYDGFKAGIPTYGYNLWTMLTPMFGFNHADSLVVSQETADRCKSTKIELILLPIYTYSLFKSTYNDVDDFGFIPNIGKHIKGNVLTYECKLKQKENRDIVQVLKTMNLSNFANIINNDVRFNSLPITSKLDNPKVFDIKIHKVEKNLRLIDKNLQMQMDRIHKQYDAYVKQNALSIAKMFGKNYAKYFCSQHYIMGESVNRYKLELKDLVYLVEIKLVSENSTSIADKMANRYAGKGVISLIIPNELRPVALNSNKFIDIIAGPITIEIFVASNRNIG